MEDWEARLTSLDARLREWNQRVDVELARVLRERKLRTWLRRPKPEELESAAEEARRSAGTAVLSDLASFLDALCDHYPSVMPQERARIRARVGMCEAVFDLLWPFIESMPERVRASGDAAVVRRAFVAIAIDDLRTDLHLVDDVMRRLVVAAASAGIDWRPILREVAEVANRSTGGGGACTREYLERFEGSAIFRERVSAELREAARGALVR